MAADRGVVRQLGKLWDACRNIVARGVLTRVDDARTMQTVQLTLLEGEVPVGAERFQSYGLSAHPLSGAEALVVFVGADRSHPVVAAVDDRRYRPRGLKPGEVCLYTDEGDSILLGRGRQITVTTQRLVIRAGESVMVETPSVSFSGNVSVGGRLEVGGGISNTGGLTSDGLSFEHHTHTCPDGETGGPH